jgi:hypothetical protein
MERRDTDFTEGNTEFCAKVSEYLYTLCSFVLHKFFYYL